jgi:predicted DNA-binding transcriptional regulator AlpA
VADDLSPLESLLTLRDVAPLVRLQEKTAQHKLARGTFPIRHVGVRPYRFTRSDVAAFVERGVITNPLLLPKLPKYFQSVERLRRRA